MAGGLQMCVGYIIFGCIKIFRYKYVYVTDRDYICMLCLIFLMGSCAYAARGEGSQEGLDAV